MPNDETRALVTALHRIWSSGATDELPVILTPEFHCHLPRGWNEADLIGPAAMAAAILDHRSAFPDWTEHVHDVIVEGPRAASRFTAMATHLGPFQGLEATGRKVSVDEVSFFRIKGGRIAEQWFLSDDLALHQQLHSP
jgi:predicted ester cyclase